MDFYLSEKQFGLIMGVLNENMKEGVTNKPIANQPAAPSSSSSPAVSKNPSLTSGNQKPSQAIETKENLSVNTIPKLALDVYLARIKMTILKGVGLKEDSK